MTLGVFSHLFCRSAGVKGMTPNNVRDAHYFNMQCIKHVQTHQKGLDRKPLSGADQQQLP